MTATVYLLERGADIDWLLVKTAVERSDTQGLTLLLAHGWDINEALTDQEPPALYLAVHDTELVAWIISHGADPNKRCWLLNLTPLSIAVQSACMPVIQMLLKAGGSTDQGELLHYAVRRTLPDYMEVLGLLVEKGTKVNRIMYEDDPMAHNYQKLLGLGTALHEAAKLGRTDVIQFLVEHGADPGIRDSLGDLPEDIARLCAQDDARQRLMVLRVPVVETKAL